MNTDTLGRRKRTVSQPIGKTIKLDERDLRLLAGLRRHNPLPTPLAFEFWKGKGPAHYNSFQDRLKKLFHGTEEVPPFLLRPPELNPRTGSNYEPAWYEPSPQGEEVAWIDTPAVPRRDGKHHRGMGACITASFEILAPSHGARFVHHEEIFTHERCPAHIKRAKNPLLIGDYEPDALFGLENTKTNRFKFYVAEFDRGTESFTREDKLQNSITQKLDKLLKLFAARTYETHWGLPNLTALFLFTNERRIAQALAYLANEPLAKRFLFKTFPDFARYQWRAPREPLGELYTPWVTLGGTKSLIDEAR
jgi:hypothetical protein